MIGIDDEALAAIPGLIRCETHDRDALGEVITELTHTVYSHDQVFGRFCTVQDHIDCPPDALFAYLANPLSLCEWTYSVRALRPTTTPDLLVGVDARDTPLFCRTVANGAARTVDYHCAWDQGAELWMIYLNRVVPAELVLGRAGSVLIWSNCRHRHYDRNPFPELAPPGRREWVGDWWPLFPAGHAIELANLKAIVEHRHRLGVPLGPCVREVP